MDDDVKHRDRERVKQLIRNIANEIKLERLKRPFSMLPPKPFHFPQFSKLDRPWIAHPVKADGLEIDALHDIYGMPRDIPQMILTVSGIMYGQEFADFSVEFFGLKGETDLPDEVDRLAERSIGDRIKYSNADPDTLPFGAGCSFSITNQDTGECIVNVHAWRWRVFMDNSSLCLENNWHTNDLIGGGWIPFILGIVYANPEKMVADAIRFAPAFRLCNLIDAELGKKRGGDQRPQWMKELWSDDGCKQFAMEVRKLKVDWDWIKSNYSLGFSSSEWLDELKKRTEFQAMLAKYPKLTDDLLNRITDDGLAKRDREPVALAYCTCRARNGYL